MECDEIIEFYGLRRSGNHGILEWLKFNIDQSEEKQITKNKVLFSREKLIFVNEANLYCNQKMLLDLMTKYKIIILGYEDCQLEYSIANQCNVGSKRVVLLREFRNLYSSRKKSIIKDNFSPYITNAMRLDNFFRKLYLSYLEQANLIFDQWIGDKEYRDNFMLSLGYENLDKTSIVKDFGGGSSFVGIKRDTNYNLMNRYKEISPTEENKMFYDSLVTNRTYIEKFNKLYNLKEKLDWSKK